MTTTISKWGSAPAPLDRPAAALALRGVRELRTELPAAIAGNACGDALHGLANAYRSYAGRHPGRYDESVVAPEPGDAEHVQASAEILAVVTAVLAGYGIAGDDAVDAIRAIRAALHGYVVLGRGGFAQVPAGARAAGRRRLCRRYGRLGGVAADRAGDRCALLRRGGGGTWLAPRAARRLADPARLALEVVLFGAGGLALLAAGQAALGVALAVLGIVNALLVRVVGTSSDGRA